MWFFILKCSKLLKCATFWKICWLCLYYVVSCISLPKNVLIFWYGVETKQMHISTVRVSYIINALRLLHVHVSAKLVTILRKVSTKDILQKLFDQCKFKIPSFKMYGLKYTPKYKIQIKLWAEFKWEMLHLAIVWYVTILKWKKYVIRRLLIYW